MKKRYSIPLAIVVAVPVSLYLALKLPVFGSRPADEDKIRFAESAAYNQAKGVFENRRSELIESMRAESMSFEVLKEWFSERADGRPTMTLPEHAPNIAGFIEPNSSTKLIWLGHSTFLLNIAGAIVLVDPVFSDYAAPVSFTAQRFQPPVLALADLPNIDIVLISHDHYDHLDKKSIEHFANSETEFLVPLGVGVHLKRWGVSTSQIIEKDWWGSHTSHDIEFTATPAQHFSGRNGINNDETLWASWVIHSEQSRLYYSGDSGYDNHFAEIGNRYGPFDLSILENGQYDKAWASVHLFPAETLQAHVDLKAKKLMPVHWGMFELALHTWYDPVEDLSKLADEENVELVTPLLGQLITLSDEVVTEKWWQTLF